MTEFILWLPSLFCCCWIGATYMYFLDQCLRSTWSPTVFVATRFCLQCVAVAQYLLMSGCVRNDAFIITYIAIHSSYLSTGAVNGPWTSSVLGVSSYFVINPDLPEASNTTTWSRPWQVHPTCSAPNTNKSSYIQVWLHTYSLVCVCVCQCIRVLRSRSHMVLGLVERINYASRSTSYD